MRWRDGQHAGCCTHSAGPGGGEAAERAQHLGSVTEDVDRATAIESSDCVQSSPKQDGVVATQLLSMDESCIALAIETGGSSHSSHPQDNRQAPLDGMELLNWAQNTVSFATASHATVGRKF